MRILFLTRYNSNGASSRYRVYQYIPYCAQAGIDYTLAPLFSDTYLELKFQQRMSGEQYLRQALGVLRMLAHRWSILSREVPKYDVTYVQYEALPYLPFALEKYLYIRRARIVVDYDDAVYLNYERHRNWLVRQVLGSKIGHIVEHASQVILANKTLLEWARPYNPNATLIPTSVDLDRYGLDGPVEMGNSRPVIGWIGTPITSRYLRLIEQPLNALRQRYDFVLKVIGAPEFRMNGIEVRGVPWSESTEVGELRSCDIGIMPLPDDQWARGKSALKLIQYLGAGVAAVASPVGANCDVVQDGQNGLLAETASDWAEKLALLLERPELRARLAKAGRRTVEEQYSVQANAPRWLDAVHRAAANVGVR